MSKIDFNALRDRAYKCACDHGFHDMELSNEYSLCLVISELMEAVEADRKGKKPSIEPFNCGISYPKNNFKQVYDYCIKGTVAEGLADSAIRLLDLAGSIDISLEDIYDYIYDFKEQPEYKDWNDALKEMSFTERMFFSTSILTEDRDIAEVIKASIVIIFLNADLLYIDLLWHIEQKMRYNELRENKHGKKY